MASASDRRDPRQTNGPPEAGSSTERRTLRGAVHALLDGEPTWPSLAVNTLLVGVIVVSVAAIALETLQTVAGRHGAWLRTLDVAFSAVLTVEYLVRIWVAPEGAPTGHADPWRARWVYVTSPFGLIDLLAVVPAIAGVLIPISPDWLRVLRLGRLLKVARYTPGLTLFAAVLRNESRPLCAALLVVIVLLVFEAAIMFELERGAQPQAFASIPHAMWWAIVTIATVGYGDMAPVTAPGKFFGGLVMIIGIAMFAVPAGILANGFASELRKRDFVVTWQTVARVPLFSGLDASRIAEIARLLKRQVVPANYVIVRRGESADAMFFIMSGEVEVDLRPAARRMGRGQFFGEIALLTDTLRTATVTAVSECQLLSLEVADFRRLLDAHPDLRATISEVAAQRAAAAAVAEATAVGAGTGAPG